MLLKNRNDTLPLKSGSVVAVVGDACNSDYDLGQMYVRGRALLSTFT